MPKAKKWIITTGGHRPIDDIAKDLAAAGLTGTKVLKEIGTITGSSSAKSAARLRKVRGVTDVSPDLLIDVGPPNSPSETW